MNASIFADLLSAIFPKLQNVVETERGERNGEKQRTYLHKTMLDKVYSADQKWTSASVDTRYVKADTIALNSPLPIKKRDSLAHASGTLPKQGISRVMEESDINTINIMKAQDAPWVEIAKKLTRDPVFCSIGLDEANEYNFLYGLCNGVIAVEDTSNTGTALRVDFGYLAKNGFGVETKGELTVEDMERVIEAANADGNTLSVVMMSKSRFNQLRNTRRAQELVASANGTNYYPDTVLRRPTTKELVEAIKDELDLTVVIVDRTILSQKNGSDTPVKPWSDKRIVYLPSNKVGSLVWGTLAEKTNPVEGVTYQTVDDMKLISSYRTTNPLTETTAGQMLALTVIENVDQIYYQDTDNSLELATEDSTEAGAVDTSITLNGQAYTKSSVVTALNNLGVDVKQTDTDKKVVNAVNKLSDEDEATLMKAIANAKITA